MEQRRIAQAIIDARQRFQEAEKLVKRADMEVEEGGCGVTGFACSIPVSGKHIFAPSVQMHNRGNGKGGGLAAVGLTPAKLGVDQKTLDEDFLLQVALLDESALPEMEARFIRPHFRVDHEAFLETIDDYRDVPGLEVKPPAVKRYFVRVKPEALAAFRKERNLEILPFDKAEEEFVYQNTYQLNLALYSALGEKKAFVLSHGRNMMILKIVGYAEQVAQYYKLENFDAHIWIAHQRYPTKGRVWHPGGAHPFIGLDEALVHNGDFANYYSVSQYLRQRNIYPLFLTDTEVSVQIVDFLNRVYAYPLEYIIEALAPTGEMDFDHLSEEKQRIYRQIQATHIHGSPDGPWFFIIARTDVRNKQFQLIGITDTSMLRPQVFALQKGEVEIGLICSEKQAIDATLESLAKEDPRFGTVADHYWNARGGSYTDGGAFIFTVKESSPGKMELTCTDKFGRVIDVPAHQIPLDVRARLPRKATHVDGLKDIVKDLSHKNIRERFTDLKNNFHRWDYARIDTFLDLLLALSEEDDLKGPVISFLTLLLNQRYPMGNKRRRSVLQMVSRTLDLIFRGVPMINDTGTVLYGRRIDFESRKALRAPEGDEKVLVADASHFPPEGAESFAGLISEAYRLGWRRFVCFGNRGQRFLGCGLGPDTKGVRIDAYGSTGDYLASGIDGLEIYVHGNAQDQLGQIMKSGKLVVYGDVGQTFMYGAKGGEVYVLGNAAGRPFINAVGKPRIVLNGTALDFLAESFMAGDPHHGGGFVILNGLTFDHDGNVIPRETPYPGSNLFSLASGGAIFVRDPHKKIVPEQLNGGMISPFTEDDWQLLLSYLEENERLFGISIDDHLLTVDGKKMEPHDVYRTISPDKLSVLASSTLRMNEEWEEED
ncbi:MAG: glutamate synthase [Deltaproteobacteria bacterium RBG_13_52_11]|nr:MAG: glutamate synthase [Deltaproteobacteria bacterium RBG_13_52_11]